MGSEILGNKQRMNFERLLDIVFVAKYFSPMFQKKIFNSHVKARKSTPRRNLVRI